MATDPYDIGFRKPPKSGQFKKGASGNPGGRPKGKPTLEATFKKLMHEKIRVTENGKPKMIPRIVAVMLQLLNKAASGDQHAMALAIKIATRFDDPEGGASAALHDIAGDQFLMESFLKDLDQPEDPSIRVEQAGEEEWPINVIRL